MTIQRKLGIIALLAWTLAVTVLRSVQCPNDFAEAHWLLDYRFGFVRRGLIGSVVSIATGILHAPITEQLILILSIAAFLGFCLVLVLLSLRMIRRSGGAATSVLVALVFLSSPFMVMSAQLLGYYDNIIIMLAAGSVGLLLKGRPWLAALVQTLAILVHENALFVCTPVFFLAWLLVSAKRNRENAPPLPRWPWLLPGAALAAILVSQWIFVAPDFEGSFMAHLARFPFIEKDRSILVPVWIMTPFGYHLAQQKVFFFSRLFSVSMWGLVLPSALVIVLRIIKTRKIALLSAEALALCGVCVAPQLMHVVAWDTTRIWTYTIVCAFLALWTYTEVFPSTGDSSTISPLCLLVLVANAATAVPLMDNQVEFFSLRERLCLYLPAVLGALVLLFRDDNAPDVERLSIRCVSVLKRLWPARHDRPGD